MKKMYLIIDESGAKGYSNNKEQSSSEFGLIVGFLIPEEWIDTVRLELNMIRQKFHLNGKMHITDLSSSEQNIIREEIFNYFLSRNIYFVYEAIYTQGFFEYHKTQKNSSKKIKEQLKSKIKFSNNNKKELLHKYLFQGIFGKAIHFFMERIGDEFQLKIISDNIEESIKQEFYQAIDEFINIGKKSKKKMTGYDTEKKELVHSYMTFEIKEPLRFLEDYSNIQCKITSEDSSLTFAADVLSNSLYRILNESECKLKANPLNTYEAVENFHLNNLIYGIYDHNQHPYIVDKIYEHPNNKDIKG